MTLDKDFVLSALLQHNYLPTQHEDHKELPPTFSTKTFTPGVARTLVKAQHRNKSKGYDAIEYRMTRFNGVPRLISIPHPVAHARLSLCIHQNWNQLQYIAQNEHSTIKPVDHGDDRIIRMDYDNWRVSSKRSASLGFARKYIVCTDISNFFPSIYSHAIPWAVVGMEGAKKAKMEKGKWFNQLDETVRHTKRNETNGVLIGPATSNVVSEAILARVDKEISSQLTDVPFVRAIDDYTAYCRTKDEAEEFIRLLSVKLSQYELLLNAAKTEILPLPQPGAEGWLAQLALQVPSSNEISEYSAIRYLDFAVGLAKETPDGSVLKYAVKTLVSKVQKLSAKANLQILSYVLTLAYHQPILLPHLDQLFKSAYEQDTFISEDYGNKLNDLAGENAHQRRSDGACWSLYYMNKYGVDINDEAAKGVYESEDCLSFLLLYMSGQQKHQEPVIKFAKSLDRDDEYKLDQYWMLLYQLYLHDKIDDPYQGEDTFKVLKGKKVSFLVANA